MAKLYTLILFGCLLIPYYARGEIINLDTPIDTTEILYIVPEIEYVEKCETILKKVCLPKQF
jgi:hypothetical protein